MITNKYVVSAFLRPLRIYRWYSSTLTTTLKSYFDLFPKSFPGGGPPSDPFKVAPKALRREFRLLQSEHHPDILIGSQALSKSPEASSGDFSAFLNKAYTTIQNPYTRVSHLIELYHPQHPDISQDDVSKKMIEKFQSESEESSLEYKGMLMTVLDAHESLEFANSEEDLEPLSDENKVRIEETEETIDQLLIETPIDWDKVMLEAIRLKYWVNIQNGIKDWEPGKPVLLTH
ncbi:hypothetical protein PSN45_001577 [Yamadazyma tenuis]|uniref:uncharacterized protein n=1 Tax=Candida tenuis TaxID=2315449 RepID=UPI0027A4ECA6|nr:hypothetical protein PSN45_001577 [Yamadazyma tenuis]